MFPTPQGLVPFVPGGVRYQRAEWDRVHGCGRGVRPECMSNSHAIHTPHMPPIRTIGTTPLGLFMSLAFTRGSASAAQPRALWHNTFGVGKEGPRMNADGGTVWKSQSGTHNGVVPRHHICGRIPLGFPDGLFGPPPDRRAATNLVCASFCRAKELQCLHRHGFTSAPEFLFQGRRGPVSGHARSNRKSRGGWPGIPAPL